MQLLGVALGLATLFITTMGGAHRIDQVLFTKRLGQEIHRASFHRSHCHGDVAVPGDEHDGYLDAGDGQFVLKVQAAAAL
ncbi:hypothetical protein D9M73_288270 [compost metagenome]